MDSDESQRNRSKKGDKYNVVYYIISPYLTTEPTETMEG